MWPFYDRRLHDVQMDAIEVNTPIVLLEGNYLLLDAPKWRDLKCDYSVFITADEEFLRKRLVERKSRGGASLQEAEAFYERCDGPNVRLCLENSLPADLLVISANIAFGCCLREEDVPCQGITQITSSQVSENKFKGKVFKLIAHAEQKADGSVSAAVEPLL